MLAEMRREQGLSETPFFLNPQIKCPRAQEFDEKLSARIVGQEDAIHDMSGLYQLFLAGLNQTNRPLGTLLFLGPTGSGKTRVVEAAAEVLFGDPRAISQRSTNGTMTFSGSRGSIAATKRWRAATPL